MAYTNENNEYAKVNKAGSHTPFLTDTQGAVCGCQGTTEISGGKKQRGGNGYGFAADAAPIGQGGPGGIYAPVTAYQNNAVNNPLNLNASQAEAYPTVPPQGQSGGKRHTRARKGRSRSRSRRRNRSRSRRRNRSRSRRRGRGRKKKACSKCKHVICKCRHTKKSKRSTRRSTRRSSSKKLFRSPKVKYLNQSGGWDQYQNNVPLSYGYSQGAPPTLDSAQSMLANPPPFTRYNLCPDNI
jgi:hypothetical protein